jgi:hypothetical protein
MKARSLQSWTWAEVVPLASTQRNVGRARPTQLVDSGANRRGATTSHPPTPSGVNPLSQAMPQALPSQVGLPFAGSGHGVHEVLPQFCTLVLSTQALSHQ